MLKNISSLGVVLNKREQESIMGSGILICRPHECPIGEEWSRVECTCVDAPPDC
ncbi:MAG: hypothetical protein ACI9Y7_000788 [Dokdonia sp.]|jgi:hypothetical protein